MVTVLDAYCNSGGATRGYQLAGADYVVGVDIEPQPNYIGDEFIQGDAVEFIRKYGAEFDFMHASPPCQGEGALAKGTDKRLATRHPHLIDPTRVALRSTGRPWVIENVAGSSVRKDLMLCGEMFQLGVLQHRFFEFRDARILQPVHPKHRGRVRGWRHGQYFDGPYVAAYGNGGGKATVAEMREAKRIDWTDDRVSLCEAIPPAYTEFIGRQLWS